MPDGLTVPHMIKPLWVWLAIGPSKNRRPDEAGLMTPLRASLIGSPEVSVQCGLARDGSWKRGQANLNVWRADTTVGGRIWHYQKNRMDYRVFGTQISEVGVTLSHNRYHIVDVLSSPMVDILWQVSYDA